MVNVKNSSSSGNWGKIIDNNIDRVFVPSFIICL